ncbi:YafY family transcriptional regulator [Echinicola strongylocentroti]|uniref:YafY family transcriptional regulator n=1 Tax=Echinicola strongylocentroti TaxID=1795355 RepID=A0A2Z4IPM8_9BACT|nr:YafY family protein [Echinicola strongylocentroti]AWW32669.1 YafY family transcriptional regulator [Echinicola strongylocentroti]
MNRIDRLTAILTHLQTKRLVKAQQLADRFEISLRTVYRDVRALEEAGVPIIGEAGAGYSLVEGYRLPPVMFTQDEAMSFVVAEKMVEKLTDRESAVHFKEAMYKIRAVLKNGEKAMYEQATSFIAVRKRPNSLQQSNRPKTVPTILSGVVKKIVLEMEYKAMGKESPSKREIEPMGIYYYFDQWYMIAFCRLRQAYRTFRIDRILKLNETGQCFEDKHPSLQAYLKELENQKELTKIEIQVDKEVAPYLSGDKYDYGLVYESEQEDKVRMTFMLPYENDFIRWYCMFAEYADILSPNEVKLKAKDKLQQKLARIKKLGTLLT